MTTIENFTKALSVSVRNFVLEKRNSGSSSMVPEVPVFVQIDDVLYPAIVDHTLLGVVIRGRND